MRCSRCSFFAAALAAALQFPLHAQAPDAAKVLADARTALGGDDKLSAVKSFVATGRTRQVRGNNLVPIEFEINCELPDKFVRKDEIPAQDTDPTTLGFRGEELIQFPAGRGRAGAPAPVADGGRAGAPADGRGRGGPPPNPAQQRLTTVKQDFARLMLGVFATSTPSFPVTFKYGAQGQAPEGVADILDVTGPANFSARLVVQRDTHLPVMLIWQVPPTNVVMKLPGQAAPENPPPGSVVVEAPAPPAATASDEDKKAYADSVAVLRREALAKAKPVEYRMYYADYRDAGGIKWPFRLRRAIAGETVEETTFDRIRINAKIDPKKFEVPK
jgi:hypothetical protein